MNEVKRRAAQWHGLFCDYYWDYRAALDDGRTHAQALDLADVCATTEQLCAIRITAAEVIAAEKRLLERTLKRC